MRSSAVEVASKRSPRLLALRADGRAHRARIAWALWACCLVVPTSCGQSGEPESDRSPCTVQPTAELVREASELAVQRAVAQARAGTANPLALSAELIEALAEPLRVELSWQAEAIPASSLTCGASITFSVRVRLFDQAGETAVSGVYPLHLAAREQPVGPATLHAELVPP